MNVRNNSGTGTAIVKAVLWILAFLVLIFVGVVLANASSSTPAPQRQSKQYYKESRVKVGKEQKRDTKESRKADRRYKSKHYRYRKNSIIRRAKKQCPRFDRRGHYISRRRRAQCMRNAVTRIQNRKQIRRTIVKNSNQTKRLVESNVAKKYPEVRDRIYRPPNVTTQPEPIIVKSHEIISFKREIALDGWVTIRFTRDASKGKFPLNYQTSPSERKNALFDKLYIPGIELIFEPGLIKTKFPPDRDPLEYSVRLLDRLNETLEHDFNILVKFEESEAIVDHRVVKNFATQSASP